MNLQPEQKSAVAVAVVAIVILGGITLLNRPHVKYEDATDYTKLQEQDQAQQLAYDRYLQSLKPDPKASKELLQELVSPADVQKQVEAALDIRQKIVLPSLADNQIIVTPPAGRTGAVNYFASVAKLATDYNSDVLGTSKSLFDAGQDPGMINRTVARTDALVQQLKQTPAPADLVKFHKAQILAFRTYRDVVNSAKQYNLKETPEPWSRIYGDYQVINSQIAALDNEFSGLDRKYQLSSVELPVADAGRAGSAVYSSPFVKTAHAQVGGSVVVIGNIPDAIKDGIKQGLASAFAGFATKFLDKLITQIEHNYRIANFLYYSDTLVKGEYVDDYLKKYVPNAIDQQIVKRFIPQFGCGSSQQDLQKIFQIKAQQYLGYDPAAVDPSDPNFYAKMARVGDFFASPQGWELYYKDVADSTRSAAQSAASQEITSPGLKSARDLVNNQISKSLSSINNAEAAAYVSILDLGVVNVENIASKLVSSITTSLFNKFIFNGAIVFKEQETCIPLPQLQPVVPVSDTAYQDPSAKN